MFYTVYTVSIQYWYLRQNVLLFSLAFARSCLFGPTYPALVRD